MKNPVLNEIVVAGWFIVCGCVSGVWYDFFKALRKKGFEKGWMVATEDVAFWVGETTLVYCVLYYANNGVLRWYEFVCTLLGFVLYRCMLSSYFLAVWGNIFTVFTVLVLLVKKFISAVGITVEVLLGKKSNKTNKKQP